MREEEHPDLHWDENDKKLANPFAIMGFLFNAGWVTFLLIILAPSCPNKTPQAYYEYGKHYVSEGDYVQAQRYFTKAITMKPDYYDAYTERIKAYEQSDSIPKAINDYTTILSIFKLSVEQKGQILFLRANDYFKILEDSLACKDWNDACELNVLKACTSLRNNCKKNK